MATRKELDDFAIKHNMSLVYLLGLIHQSGCLIESGEPVGVTNMQEALTRKGFLSGRADKFLASKRSG